MVNQPPPRSAPAGGGVILMLGILSIVVLPLLGPFAWVFGNQALAAIRAGTMNPAEGSSASAGRICGIIGTVILALGILVAIVYMVFMMTVGRAMVGEMQKLSTSPEDQQTSVQQPAKAAPSNKSGKHDADSLTNAIVMGSTAEAESIIKRDPESVNRKDATGQTPLFMAAFVGNAKIAKVLVSHGADVNAKDGLGHTPLDNAVFFHHDDVAAILKQHGGRVGKRM